MAPGLLLWGISFYIQQLDGTSDTHWFYLKCTVGENRREEGQLPLPQPMPSQKLELSSELRSNHNGLV
jgi:hypothetical protein